MATKPRAKRLAPEHKAQLVQLCRTSKDAATIIREFRDATGVTVYPATVYKCRQRDRHFAPRSRESLADECVHCHVAEGGYPAVPWGYKHGKLCKGCMDAIVAERQEQRWREAMGQFYATRQGA